MSDLDTLAGRCVKAANDCDGPDHYGAHDLLLRAKFGGASVVWVASIGRWSVDVAGDDPAPALEALHAEIVHNGSGGS